MTAKKTKAKTEPEVVAEEQPPADKPRSIIVAASESGTHTTKVKTTRELYMEDQ